MAEILERRVDYIDIERKIEECVKQSSVYYEEMYITPIREGFKVEISPVPGDSALEEISRCISEKTGTSTSVREYPYSKVITAKYTESRRA